MYEVEGISDLVFRSQTGTIFTCQTAAGAFKDCYNWSNLEHVVDKGLECQIVFCNCIFYFAYKKTCMKYSLFHINIIIPNTKCVCADNLLLIYK